MKRIAILILCALLLASSWWRSPLPPTNHDPHVVFTRLPVEGLPAPGPGMAVEGAWVLSGKGEHFGGYSALVSLGGGRFLAASDRGRYLRFSDPSLGAPDPQMGWFLVPANDDKRQVDCESLTRDPQTGDLWAGYEQSNAIVRADANGHLLRSARPSAMRGWPSNRGPEATVRLADGRFIVLSEAHDTWLGSTGPALLFPSAPADGSIPTRFRFESPDGYRPTDMAQMPDGRMVVLLRKLELAMPPGFVSKLVVAYPAAIRAGGVWRGTVVASLAEPLPVDNFEGLAVVPRADGALTLWVISDDNTSLVQRTILLKLRWDPSQARKKGAR